MEEDGTFSSIPYDSDNEHFQKESWPPVDHPQLSNQKLAIVWEEEVQMNEVDSKEQPHALPPAGGLDDPEEAESQWGPIILPVYPMTHPSVALSFATVQWDMPVPSSQTPYPTVDNSLAELDSVSFLKPQDTDFTSEEDTQNDDGLAALQPLNSTVEEKGSVSQPCDMLNTEEETKQTTQEEEDPVWELPDCIDTDDGLAEISQADTEEEDGQSVTEEAVEPAETLLITEEGIVDSEPGEERQNVVDSRLDEEQERPDILLTGQTDLEQEPRSATVKSLKTEEQHLGRVEDENYNGEDETVTKIPCNEENEEPVSVVLKGPCEREQLGECSNHVGLIIKPDQSIHSEEFQKLTEGWRLRENTDLNNETIVEPLACEVVNQISNSEQIAEVLQHLTEICQEESEQNNQTENAYSVEPPSEQTRLCEETTAHSVEPQDSEPMHLENTEPSEQFQPSNWAELLNQTQYSNEYSNKSTEPELLDQSQHIEQREQSQQSEQLSKEEQSEQLERDNQPEQPQQPGKEELSEQPEKEGQIEESQQPEKEESREQPQQPGKEELPEQSQQPEKEGQTEQPQQPGKEELPEQSQQSEKEESTEQSQQPGKEGQTEQSQQSEKEGQTEQSQQSEKEGQTEQSQQPEKEEQPEESEQPEKEEQTEPSQQPEKEGQTEQSQQPETEQQPEESEQPEKEGLQELSEQPETEEQTELSEKEERPEESEQPEKESQPEQSRQSEVIALMPHTAVIEHPVQTEGSQQSDQSLQTSSPSPTPSTPPGMQAETDRTGETNQAENKSPEVTEHVARTEFTQEERQTKNSPQNIQPDCRKGAPMQTVMSNGGPPELAGTLENETVVDREKASCLAERLYRLDGIQRKDVVRHLDKDNDFSRAVGEEYLKFFDFTGQTLDNALRSILKVVLLIGETQERERVLQHFACRFHQCNPHSFSDAETVLMLTCALMLLNSDLHGQNVGKAMSSSDFVSNLDGMDEGQNFSKELLKNFYSSIKNEPLEWAVDEEELKSSMLLEDDAKEDAPVRCKSNPFQDVPHNSKATVFKQGFLQRKTHADIDGKRTPWGKRSWKTFYGVLRGMVLYLHKDEYKKEYHSTEEVVSVHHGLAEQAINYTKKPHVFRLQTADWRVFLFQASSRAEMSSWINRMNLVSALHSSPPFPAAVGSQRRFCRPILPASQSAHTLERQLQSHAGMLESFQNDLTFLHQNLPEGRRAKAKELEEHRVREEYLQHEICRYEVYIRVLEAWKGLNMAADAIVGTKEFALFDKALSKDFMGDEDEEVGLKKSYSSPSLDLELAPPPLVKVKRNISERRTYRKTIIPRRNKIL